MHGDALDVGLVAVCVFFGYGGYRQGFLVGALSFVGIFGGGLLGTRLAVPVVHALGTESSAPLVAIVVVFVLASVGQAVAAGVGIRLRDHLRFRPLRAVDDLGGAVLSVVAVLLIAWMLATAVAHSTLTAFSRQVRNSTVIAAVDASIPPGLRDTLSQFRQIVDNTGFPAVVGPFANEPAVSVPAPDPALSSSAALQHARPSVVKIVGDAPSCSRQIEGSGFVFAPNHVMTNAHVVAGVQDPVVQVDGVRRRAQVVLYDPRRDVAVLYVPQLRAGALSFAGPVGEGADAIVVGYPQNGPFTPVAARVRQRQDLRGPNIYQTGTVSREVYAIRAVVRPGNSGGPLLSPAGAVYGVVFAASTDTSDTGYALTAAEVAADAAAGRRATQRVSTQGCD